MQMCPLKGPAKVTNSHEDEVFVSSSKPNG